MLVVGIWIGLGFLHLVVGYGYYTPATKLWDDASYVIIGYMMLFFGMLWWGLIEINKEIKKQNSK